MKRRKANIALNRNILSTTGQTRLVFFFSDSLTYSTPMEQVLGPASLSGSCSG